MFSSKTCFMLGLVLLSSVSFAQKVYDASQEVPQSGSTFLGHTFTSANTDYRMIQQAVWRACEAGEGDVYIPTVASRNWTIPAGITAVRMDGIAPTGIRIIGQGPFPVTFTGSGAAFEFKDCRNCTIEGLGVTLTSNAQIGVRLTGDCSRTKVVGCKVRLNDGPSFAFSTIGFLVSSATGMTNVTFSECSYTYGSTTPFIANNDSSFMVNWSRGHLGFVFLGNTATQITVNNCSVSGAEIGFTNVDGNNLGYSNASNLNFNNCTTSFTGCAYLLTDSLTANTAPFRITGGHNSYDGALCVFQSRSFQDDGNNTVLLEGLVFENAHNKLIGTLTIQGQQFLAKGRVIGFYDSGFLSITNCHFVGQTNFPSATKDMVGIRSGAAHRRVVNLGGNVLGPGFADNWQSQATWDDYVYGTNTNWRVTDPTLGIVLNCS